jgi:hypothetical protein
MAPTSAPAPPFKAGGPDQSITTPNGIKATCIAKYSQQVETAWSKTPPPSPRA